MQNRKFVAYEVSMKSAIGYNPIMDYVNPNVLAVLQRQAEKLRYRASMHLHRVLNAEKALGRKLTDEDYLNAAYHRYLKREVLNLARRHGVAIGGTYYEVPVEVLIVPAETAQKNLARFFSELSELLRLNYNFRMRKEAYEQDFEREKFISPFQDARARLNEKGLAKWYEKALRCQKISRLNWPENYEKFYALEDRIRPKSDLERATDDLLRQAGILSVGEEIKIIGKACR